LEESGHGWSWYYASICLKGLRKTIKTQSAVRIDSVLAYIQTEHFPTQKYGMLSTLQIHSSVIWIALAILEL
jgi:hypothetical protein